MFPYIELFGIKLYMTGIGIVVAGIVFLLTTYQLCKKYNQDFIKLFTWLPWLLISIYVLGLYVTAIFDAGSLIPSSIKAFSPFGYRFHLIGILIACFFSLLFFLKSFRRNETKRVWMDIFFFWFTNAVIALWFFLLLGDTFIGKEYAGLLSVTALRPESLLVKYEGVYPIGLFLSFGALLINITIVLRKRISKKVWLGTRGFVLLCLLFLWILPFWHYAKHGVFSLGKLSFDLNHILLVLLMLYFIYLARKLKKPY